MRILIAGDWHSELHEEVVSSALTTLGHEVKDFKWCHYFKKPYGFWGRLVHLIRRAENKYIVGFTVNRINNELVATVIKFQPEILFIYRGTHITAKTLRAIRVSVPECILVGYNNDDPFAPEHVSYLWRIFLKALPEYDLVLAYRHANIREYIKAGARHVELLRSWFVPERHHHVDLTGNEKNKFETDVVFIGHYESDQRLEYLEEIVRQGFKLRLFGPGYDWNAIIQKSEVLRSFVPVHLVWGEDYNRALCGAKIALCFFSKLNRDTYTRRCFEIPATNTLLLSEYSDDLASLYQEGKEAEFFRTKEEMMKKIKIYLSNDNKRISIANAGNHRVKLDGHDVISRMKQMVFFALEIRRNKSIFLS